MTMTQTKRGRTAPHTSPRQRPPRVLLAAQMVGGALLVAGIILALLPANAEASTVVAGPVTLTPGSPYHSAQTINITVGANSTLTTTNRAKAGFPSGAVAIKVVECGDPGGLAANLPTKPSNCDYSTVDSIPGANVDGSFVIKGYTVYALPDTIVFGEPADQKPVCGTENDECVLGIFTNLNDFTKPHIFSGAFEVTPDPQAENAIVNGPPPSTGSSSSAAAATGGGAGKAGTTTTGALASTGANASLPWLIGVGSVLLVVGTFGRRRLARSRAVLEAGRGSKSRG